jgi:hypothetical protein
MDKPFAAAMTYGGLRQVTESVTRPALGMIARRAA